MFGHRWFLRLGELKDVSIAGLMNDANELVHCDYSFYQGVDNKGQAQTSVKGGLLHLSLYQIPDENINQWMLRSGERKSGEIQFRKTASSMPLRITFTEAQCISYQKEIGYEKIGFEAKLVISPKEILLNGIMYSNEWR